jgi:hypothetical protein
MIGVPVAKVCTPGRELTEWKLCNTFMFLRYYDGEADADGLLQALGTAG